MLYFYRLKVHKGNVSNTEMNDLTDTRFYLDPFLAFSLISVGHVCAFFFLRISEPDNGANFIIAGCSELIRKIETVNFTVV